jgi:hypothetical protein
MNDQVKKVLIVVCVLAFVGGAILAQKKSHPNPHQDRPFLAAVVRVAKYALWFTLLAEPAPSPNAGDEYPSILTDETGYAQVNHARGW